MVLVGFAKAGLFSPTAYLLVFFPLLGTLLERWTPPQRWLDGERRWGLKAFLSSRPPPDFCGFLGDGSDAKRVYVLSFSQKTFWFQFSLTSTTDNSTRKVFPSINFFRPLPMTLEAFLIFSWFQAYVFFRDGYDCLR